MLLPSLSVPLLRSGAEVLFEDGAGLLVRPLLDLHYWLAFLGDLYFHRLVPRLLLLFQCFEPEREVFLASFVRFSRCPVGLVLRFLFHLGSVS